MVFYFVRRDGVGFLLPKGEEPLPTDTDIDVINATNIKEDDVITLEDGDYVWHKQDDEWTLKKVED